MNNKIRDIYNNELKIIFGGQCYGVFVLDEHFILRTTPYLVTSKRDCKEKACAAATGNNMYSWGAEVGKCDGVNTINYRAFAETRSGIKNFL